MALSTASGSIDTTVLENQLNLSNDILKITEAIRNESAGIKLTYAVQTDSLAAQVKHMIQYAKDVRRILQIGTETKHLQEDILGINNKLGLEYIKQETIQKRINTQNAIKNELQAEFDRAYEKVQAERSKGMTAREAMESEAGTYLKAVMQSQKANESNLIILNKINSKLAQANNQVIKTTSASKALQQALSNISNIPLIGKFLEAEKVFDAFTVSKIAGFKELKNQFKSMLDIPIVRAALLATAVGFVIDKLKQAAKLVLEVDKNIVAVGNSLGVAKEGADLLVRSVYNTEQPVNNLKGLLEGIFITTGNISKAILSLQDSFGIAAVFSKEMVQSQILLTEQLGFSNEEAAGIQKYFYTSGVSAKGVLDTITKTNKYFLNNRKIISEISKVNSEIATSYKNQVGALANAVVQASRLGMTLDDTRKISDSLLNFESSIENELKAELLLGRELNYEKARSLALDGKSAEAAALLVEQTGGLNRLNQLNVIQRKALAESIGLSAEELTKFAQQEQIIQRAGFDTLENTKALYEQYKATGKEKQAQALLDSVSKQQNGEMLAQDIARIDINKRFEQSMLKIKDVFATLLAGPLTGILEALSTGLEFVSQWKGLLKGLVVVALALKAALLVSAIASVIATGGASLAAGLIVGGAAGLYALASSDSSSSDTTEIKDGAISPKGSLMISTPEGQMFKTSKNDYLYATPTPPNQMLSGNNNAPNNGETNALLREMVALMRSGGVVNMDGIKVGEVIGRTNISFG